MIRNWATYTTLTNIVPVHHKEIRSAIGIFSVCRTEYSNTKGKRPIRPYILNKKIQDECAMESITIKTIFIRATEYLGKVEVDVR
jgi:hypothetical protein